jgi:hypothetical protein
MGGIDKQEHTPGPSEESTNGLGDGIVIVLRV